MGTIIFLSVFNVSSAPPSPAWPAGVEEGVIGRDAVGVRCIGLGVWFGDTPVAVGPMIIGVICKTTGDGNTTVFAIWVYPYHPRPAHTTPQRHILMIIARVTRIVLFIHFSIQ
jgi:hypothetical protein